MGRDAAVLDRRLISILWWALACTLIAGQSGCMQRRMTIHSNPPGALVFVDGYEIGTTPCSTSFLYYGTREIRLVKDGYETLTVKQPIPAPWYQIPPLDFVSDNFVPGEIRDERLLSYNLAPQVIVPTDQLLGRAEHLRRDVQAQGTLVAPPGPIVPGVVVPRPELVPPGARPPSELLPPSGRGFP